MSTSPSVPAASSSTLNDGVYPRPVLGQMPPYAAGKPPAVIEGLTAYKLSSNENPFGPVSAVIEAIRRYAESGQPCRYPETTCSALRSRIGETFGVDPDDVVAGAGSLGALMQIITTFAGAGEDGRKDEVIFAWRSFEAYPIVVRAAGAQDVQVPLTADHRHDLEAMTRAITDRTRVILLCTPNNPTGPSLSTAEVESFLGTVPPHIMVVIDEAYIEFNRAPDAVDGVDVYRRYPNVVVLRTFSKAHGLANLRVGYSIAGPQITQYLRVMATPFAVSSLAEQAAIASLDHLDEVQERVQRVVDERERVVASLRELGFEVPQSEGNFFWLPLAERTPELVEAAGTQALSVRGFGTEGARVSVGEVEANDRLLKMMSEFGAR